MLVSTSLIISPDDGYPMVDARTRFKFVCAVRKCFPYAPNRMYVRRQKGYWLGMVGVSLVNIGSYV